MNPLNSYPWFLLFFGAVSSACVMLAAGEIRDVTRWLRGEPRWPARTIAVAGVWVFGWVTT